MTSVDMTPVEDRVPWLRKAVEWVEWQSGLPEIDRQWEQQAYYQPPEARAFEMLRDTVHPTLPRDEVRTLATQVAPHCGSAYCVAGYLGQELDPAYIGTDSVTVDDEEPLHVSTFVQAKLGLRPREAGQLFNGDNDATAVRRIAERIAGQPL